MKVEGTQFWLTKEDKHQRQKTNKGRHKQTKRRQRSLETRQKQTRRRWHPQTRRTQLESTENPTINCLGRNLGNQNMHKNQNGTSGSSIYLDSLF